MCNGLNVCQICRFAKFLAIIHARKGCRVHDDFGTELSKNSFHRQVVGDVGVLMGECFESRAGERLCESASNHAAGAEQNNVLVQSGRVCHDFSLMVP